MQTRKGGAATWQKFLEVSEPFGVTKSPWTHPHPAYPDCEIHPKIRGGDHSGLKEGSEDIPTSKIGNDNATWGRSMILGHYPASFPHHSAIPDLPKLEKVPKT